MMYYMSRLDPKGKPIKENSKSAHCQICGFTSTSIHGVRIHMASHRDGIVTSYHQKGDLYKSKKHSEGDKKSAVDYTPHEPDMRYIQ